MPIIRGIDYDIIMKWKSLSRSGFDEKTNNVNIAINVKKKQMKCHCNIIT